MPTRTIDAIKQEYHNHYQYLCPDFDNIHEVKDIWSEYEKAGISSPDVDTIMASFPEQHKNFFREVVKIASNVSKMELRIDYCPFILNDYNLSAQSAKDGYLVIIDEFYLAMLHTLTNIVEFRANDFIKDNELVRYAHVAEEIALDYLKSVDNHDLIMQLYKKDYETAEFAVYLYNSFKIFLFAHEISHHILGHTEGTVSKQCYMNGRSCNIETDKRCDYEQELEADSYGYRIFLETLNTVDGSIYYAYCKYRYEYAPLFLFDIFDRIDRLKEVRENRPIKYTTHPPPIDRKSNLLKQYQSSNPAILYYEDTLYNYERMKCALRDVIKTGKQKY